MKMKLFASSCALTLSIALFSCQNSNGNASQHDAEQQAAADSIAKAQAEQHRLDSIAKAQAEQQRLDSIRSIELKEMYANAITITSGKKKMKYYTTHEGQDASLSCTVTNNSPISISASDYSLSCTGTYRDGTDWEAPAFNKTVSAKSLDLAPGESANVTFVAKGAENISKPKVKLNISQEDFVKRGLESGK